METISFRPTEEQGQFIDGLLAHGEYASQSEVIREGLRLLQEKKAESKLEMLKQLIAEGDQSGEAQDFEIESFLQRMNAETE